MGDWIIGFVNGAIETIADTANNVFEAMPRLCPFSAFQNALSNDLLAMINWFIPISEMIFILEAWGLAIAGWYVFSIILRWIKAVQ